MTHPLVGTVLYGYCNGYFGRDSYADKRIEAVGTDWIVARDEYGKIHFADFDSQKLMIGYIHKWCKREPF